ncbi:MAG: MaoC family dehydratase [Gammaproteobacteria bacterium]
MPETRCLTADMLEVGMAHEQAMVFTHEQVRQYCELCGDHNAIHHNQEAARLRFPGVADIVVPGGLIQISITGLFGSYLPGDGSLGLTFSPERFRKPVCPGDQIVVRIELSRLRGEIAEFDIAVSDAGGSQIGAAKARLVVPDDNYRTWWQANAAAAKA